jgi:energy-coupling factor transporter ATP-binding protein EcfA2
VTEVARFEQFSYRYPESTTLSLEHLDLHLTNGLTLLTGPSGSGKTTLLRTLNGLVPHFHGGWASGEASVMGHDLRLTSTRRLAREVAMVFQEPESQFVLATVQREVAFGPENLGLPGSEIADRVESALQVMGVHHLSARRLATLSGGERQRVALASALAMGPDLLVLDEPTSSSTTPEPLHWGESASGYAIGGWRSSPPNTARAEWWSKEHAALSSDRGRSGKPAPKRERARRYRFAVLKSQVAWPGSCGT